MIASEDFKQLSPFQRGYVTYLNGLSEDEPNVPDEVNPYPPGSGYATAWRNGQQKAMIETQDNP